MHRNGTSAATRALNLLGLELPDGLLTADRSNPTGYWESAWVNRLNDQALATLQRPWWDWRPLEAASLDAARAAFLPAALAALARQPAGRGALLLKDPRLARLLPLWREALALAGLPVAVLLMLRDPLAVAQSMQRRDGLELSSGLLLWLTYMLEAEAASRDLPRSILNYAGLIADWRGSLAVTGQRLGLAWPVAPDRAAAAIEALLAARPAQAPERPVAERGLGLLLPDLSAIHAALAGLADDDSTANRARFDRTAIGTRRLLLDLSACSAAPAAPPMVQDLTRGTEATSATAARLREVEARLRAAADATAALRVALRTLQASRSWRYTAPLRRLRRLLPARPAQTPTTAAAAPAAAPLSTTPPAVSPPAAVALAATVAAPAPQPATVRPVVSPWLADDRRESAEAPAPEAALLADPLLDRGLYRHWLPPFLHDLADDGAIGLNAGGTAWRIELQRFGADLVQAGLARRDGGLMAAGWRALDWGLRRLDGDGGFPGSGGLPWHGAAFYLEGLTRALLLHRWYRRPLPTGLCQEPGLAAARIAQAILTRPSAADRAANASLTHRWWLLAAALAGAGALREDPACLQAADDFAAAGAAALRDDGLVTERTGFDLRYHAIALLSAARWALLRPAAQRAPLLPALERMAAALVARQGADGCFDTAGSTRLEQELDPSGYHKVMDYPAALQGLALTGALTGSTAWRSAAERLVPHAGGAVARRRAGPPQAPGSLAVVFVVQAGEWELKGLLLAASLRRHLGPPHELIAAVPGPAATWGQLAPESKSLLDRLGVRRVAIENPIAADFPHANKIACLAVSTTADRLLFLDSDMLCLGPFATAPDLQQPLAAKVADLNAFGQREADWQQVYAAAAVTPPAERLAYTLQGDVGWPAYNSGALLVERARAADLAATWADCARRIRDDPRVPPSRTWSDQIGLAVGLQRLGWAPAPLDARFNYPAHVWPLPTGPGPLLVHYHTPGIVAVEPRLLALVRALAADHPWIGSLLARHAGWQQLLSAPRPATPLSPAPPAAVTSAEAPTLLISGISRSGTSLLCRLLDELDNCVALNETPELSAQLDEALPWGIAGYLRQVRADVLRGADIRNKVAAGAVIDDTARLDQLAFYRPKVRDAGFLLAAKNTFAFLTHLPRLLQVLPQARLVLCVRQPLDTVASWLGSFPHLATVDLSSRPTGQAGGPWLPPALSEELRSLLGEADLAVRRARFWSYCARRVLAAPPGSLVLRYDDLVTQGVAALAPLLAGWDPGQPRQPNGTTAALAIRGKRSLLGSADIAAIERYCTEPAAALGLTLG